MEYSVLMCVYYKEKPESLRLSIESVMSQTILPNDFVLVCDGPLTEDLDDTIFDLKKIYPIINDIRLERNSGLGIALSLGIVQTKNDIVMRMDSDDLCLPNRAELQLPLMEKYDLVGGFVAEFDDDNVNKIIGIRRVPEKYEDIYRFAKNRNPFNHPTTMFRKQAILDAGNYQHLLFLEDYYLWIRFLKKNNKAYNIQKVLVKMRSGIKMRARRGGKEPIKSLRRLRKYMYKSKMINLWSYVFVTSAQILVLSMPLWVKTHIYNVMLRH